MIVGRGEYDLRHAQFALDQLLDHAEAVQARHLHVEKHQVGIVFLDQCDRFEAVLTQSDHVYLGKALQQVKEFLARGAFVVHDDGINCHEFACGEYSKSRLSHG